MSSNKKKPVGSTVTKGAATTKPAASKVQSGAAKKSTNTTTVKKAAPAPTSKSEKLEKSEKSEKLEKIQSKSASVDVDGAAAQIEKIEVKEKKEEEINIALKELADVLLDDKGEYMAQSKKWPVILDNNGSVGTFLKYRDVNYIDTFHPANMELEKIRLALLGGIRFGKAVLIDLRDNPDDMWKIFCDRCKEIKKELIDDIIGWEILSDKYYKELVRDGDDECYSDSEFSKAQIYELNKKFKFFILSTSPNISPDLKQAFITIVVS